MKILSFQQRNGSDKKKLNGNCKTKKYNSKIKNSLDGLNSKVEIIEDGSSKFEEKSIDSIQSTSKKTE